MNWRIGEVGWRFLPGSLVGLAFTVLWQLAALQPLEQIAYNTLFRLRGERSWDDRIVVIAIDDASINRLGRFPWPRQRYVKLLNVLTEANPSVVAFNLVWSESSPDDPKLAAAMERNGRVVLAKAWDSTGLSLFPVASLQSAAIASGHIMKQQDTDGLTRKEALQSQYEPALGLAAVRAYALVQAPVPLPDLEKPLWINWMGPIQQLHQYSFVDVIERRVPPQTFQDKIVLVGVTATGIEPLSTPFDRNPPASGVHLHAAVINTLLQQNPLQPLSPAWVLLVLLLGGPGLSLLLSNQNEEYQFLIWALVCTSWIAIVVYLFSYNSWLPLALPLGLFTTTAGAVVLSERLRMNALLHQQVNQLWQTYQHDLVGRQPPTPGLNVHYSNQQTSSMESANQLAALAEQLGRSQSTQVAIARSLSIGLLAADWDGFVWFCNPVAAAWLQIQIGDYLVPKLVPEWLAEDQWQTDLQILRQQSNASPRELHRGDRWFSLKLEPLSYRTAHTQTVPNGLSLDGLLVVLEEITTQKQAEAALEKQVEELQRVAYLKDDFLSTVSHELRSPMANIKMAIELLKISKSPQSTEHYLQILQSECAREIELIGDLLDLQRLEAGAQTYEPVEIDLPDWLPSILAPFYERTENQHQQLQVNLTSPMPPLVSDRASLERIIVELVTNACKYTPPNGSITVATRSTELQIEILVSNSGTEIPEAELPRIFEKFYRIPQSDPWKRGGTGLGLALIKKLTESLGGSIHAESVAGQTQFAVLLPLNAQK